MKNILFALILFPLLAWADCPQFYPHGQAIPLLNAVELCNSFYAVQFDVLQNRPVISVEKFRYGGHAMRLNDFHPDDRLPQPRAENSDYLHSGYDKGHLTPAADATNEQEMHDTFLLSNMTPQEPTLNRESWRIMEMQVRHDRPDYIVTGALYAATRSTIGAHKVPVPTGYYKITYTGAKVAAYYADNKDRAPAVPITIGRVRELSGINFPD